jgi:alkaline phosphatase
MPHMALVSTSGTDSVVTDSANSMSAYTTGHKSCVNAMGVYCARNKSNLDHPRVETISELVKRARGMAVGVVTNTEIEDATPAAMVAHNRLRADFNNIVKDFFSRAARRSSWAAARRTSWRSRRPGSKRIDEDDYVTKFRDAGYSYVTTNAELSAAKGANKLLGLFNPANIDGALDRFFLKKGNGREIPRPAGPDRPGARRARRAVEERQGLRADGGVRPHRQVFALRSTGSARSTTPSCSTTP